MDYAKLKVLLADPACPEGDQAAANWLNAQKHRPPKDAAFVSYRTMSSILGIGPGQVLVDKLEIIFAQAVPGPLDPGGTTPEAITGRALKRHIGYMRNEVGVTGNYPGIDVAREEVREFLPSMIGVGGITSDEVNALLAYGLQPEQQKYPTVYSGEVAEARANL